MERKDIMTRDEAWALLTRYNQGEFHLRHARTLEGVMRYFAGELGYGDEADFWALVGKFCPDWRGIREEMKG